MFAAPVARRVAADTARNSRAISRGLTLDEVHKLQRDFADAQADFAEGAPHINDGGA